MTNMTRRQALGLLTTIAVVPAIPSLALSKSTSTSIDWKAWRSDGNDFFRAPVLLTGEKEAILIDGSFNYPAGHALVDAIKASGKRLTTIYISCSDPDYYFNLAPVKAAFPDARVIAATATIDAINENVQRKLDTWGPQLGENGPQSLDDIVFAEPYDAASLNLEGEEIEIVTSTIMKNRRYLWIPSIKAMVGGIHATQGLHVWTADSPTTEDRQTWVREIDFLIARKPEIVVAGHASDGLNNGIESLIFTRDYLEVFEKEASKAANSGELIAAMQRLYPDLDLVAGLEIGAKVAKGEMSWG